MKKTLTHYLLRSYLGYFIWRKIIRNHQLQNNDFVLILAEDTACNYYALKYAGIFKQRRKIRKLIAITADERIPAIASEYSSEVDDIEVVTKSQLSNFIDFFAVYTFEGRILVVSIQEPFGRNVNNALGLKGVTREELVVFGMLRLYPVTLFSDSPYTGADKDVQQFILEKEKIIHADKHKI